MDKKPKISIIVPVYNVGKYLRRCIDSILAQSFPDFELLLIDDGSTDNSGEICDEYASKDLRIKVFHKENGGVSSARNVGLDNVCGEWVAFIDADDEIKEGYLNIRKEYQNSDVIIKPYCLIRTDDNCKPKYQKPRILRGRDAIFRYYVRKRNNALWDKLIRRELIGSSRFNVNVSIGEDFLFFLGVLPNVKVLAFDNVGAYCYYVREGSAMQSVDVNRRIKILWENVSNVREITGSDELLYVQSGIIYSSYVVLLYHYRHLLDKDEYERLKGMIRELRLRDLKYVDITTVRKLYGMKITQALNM